MVASSWVLGKTNHNKKQDNLLSSMKTPIITFFIHATIGLRIHWANGSRCWYLVRSSRSLMKQRSEVCIMCNLWPNSQSRHWDSHYGQLWTWEQRVWNLACTSYLVIGEKIGQKNSKFSWNCNGKKKNRFLQNELWTLNPCCEIRSRTEDNKISNCVSTFFTKCFCSL